MYGEEVMMRFIAADQTEEEAEEVDVAVVGGMPTLKTRSSPDKKLKSPMMIPNSSLGLAALS